MPHNRQGYRIKSSLHHKCIVTGVSWYHWLSLLSKLRCNGCVTRYPLRITTGFIMSNATIELMLIQYLFICLTGTDFLCQRTYDAKSSYQFLDYFCEFTRQTRAFDLRVSDWVTCFYSDINMIENANGILIQTMCFLCRVRTNACKAFENQWCQ